MTPKRKKKKNHVKAHAAQHLKQSSQGLLEVNCNVKYILVAILRVTYVTAVLFIYFIYLLNRDSAH